MATRAADVAASAFAGALNADPPVALEKTLTYDQGKEMAAHKVFTSATDMNVYFADPQSPWQRGTNENTNGLLRQYFPKETALSGYTQVELNAVAVRLNDRPRKTLSFATPKEALSKLLAELNENLEIKPGVAYATWMRLYIGTVLGTRTTHIPNSKK